MDVSVIIVNYNTAQLTLNAIQSVYDFTIDLKFEIIVVDNNSKDDSIFLIEQQFPQVIIIKNNKNLGFGKANNKGFEIAQGKYCFLLNTDTYLLSNAIKILFNFMEHIDNVKVGVSGAMLFKKDKSPNVYAGTFPSFKMFVQGSFWKYFFLKSKLKCEMLKPLPQLPSKTIEVDFVSGASFFVRKNIINKIGGFDSRFFMYGEDLELSYRIKKKLNYSSAIVPEAKIVHLSQGSSDFDSESKSFKLQFIKSRGIYYKITVGKYAQLMYLITSYKRLYFN